MRSMRMLFVVAILFQLTLPHAYADNKLWVEGKDSQPIIPEINLPSFAPAIETLGQSVVNIRTEGKDNSRGAMGGAPQGGGDPSNPFDFFFRLPPEQQSRRFSSLGSGFVIHPDGYIVTNQHVVEGASKILVSFRDDKVTYKAEVVGSDPKTDLALLKVDRGGNLPAAVLGESDNVKAGDWVIAIGNPFRLGHTATVGIVSAKSRKIPGGKPYDDFIQTDASINPGNSGGPLFNSRGEVIGVNTAIFSPGRFGSSGFNIGIGFAIPINLVKGIITQLKEKGRVTRGWLGVLIQPVSEDVAEAMKLKDAHGALVADVMPNSPADKAEFKRGDVILSYDGKKVEENDDLPLMVAETELGRSVEVELIRNGSKKKLNVTIQELKDEEPEPVASGEAQEEQLGLSMQELSPEIARALGIEEVQGVIVTNVEPDSAAFEAGLRKGDLVVEISSKPVRSVKDFRNLTKNLKPDVPLLMLVKRNNSTIFLTLRLE